ncbi:MAG: hypothetical protein RL637_547 [Pseudomonadota bacterium]|jgi:homospermidine synthase
MPFKGNILVIGCGFVSHCTLPLILKHLSIATTQITVIDPVDNRHYIREAIEQGVHYRIDKITQENLATKLAEYVSAGDFIVDLAWNIDCVDILQWCHQHQVLYINTSVELWNPYNQTEKITDKTLYARHMRLREMVESWDKQKGTTAVIDHGANPGLVSHFTKKALADISHQLCTDKPNDCRIAELEDALKKGNFAKIAQLLDVKVIHISERDMQISNQPKQVNEFVNTWSIEGLYEEGIAPAEMGWGTHEKHLPPSAYEHQFGPKNQICLARMGIKTWVRSWVPCGEITGLVIRHGEAFTISDHLTIWQNGKAIYRPTVHYAYCLCDAAINSLHELEMRQFNLQPNQRIMTDDIIKGQNELGVLLMGHDFKSWWTGSILDIQQSRELVPHQNATTLQVACSVVAAMIWMINNPRQGVCVPDDLPYQQILQFAEPYLGQLISQPVDWTPLQNRVDFYQSYYQEISTISDDPWQFEAFLVK